MERLFLRLVRPAAPAACMAVYAVLELVRPETPSERILPPLAVSVLAGLVYRVLQRPLGTRRVLQLLVVVDTLLIAAMTIALREPDALAIAYFWSIALAAFFLGAKETVAATAVAAVCAAAVPFTGSYGTQTVVVVTDVLVLCLIGALLAILAHQARRSDAALLSAGELDSAALRIAGRVRSSLEVGTVLDVAVEELATATRSARGLCQLVTDGSGLHQWTRPGVRPVESSGLTATASLVAATGEPLVVERPHDDLPAQLLDYLRRYETQSLVAIPILRHGEPVGVIGLHDDRPRQWGPEILLVERVAPQIATALAQAEAYEHERRVADLREQLIANVSHELRTPLTSTIGFLQTLARPDLDASEAERRRFLEIAREQAERLAVLVEDLLDLAALERRAAPPAGPVAIRGVVERAARELRFDGRPLELELGDDLTAAASADRLVQVFSNLLRNALVHGSGAIRVAGSGGNGSVTVRVSDDGAGIPERLREQVFIPFARWNAAADGTGLGLPISRAIVEAYGGTLVYDGAFVVTLPAG